MCGYNFAQVLNGQPSLVNKATNIDWLIYHFEFKYSVVFCSQVDYQYHAHMVLFLQCKLGYFSKSYRPVGV